MDLKGTIKFIFYLLVILGGIAVLKLLSEFDYQSRKTDTPQWELVWSDEFEKDGAPNDTIWQYDLGDGCPVLCGWGNNEQQYYTSDSANVFVNGGQLHIKAIKNDAFGKPYTSARIKSKPEFDIKYGKVCVKLKNPSGVGTWPAVWMLPTKNYYGYWPKSGEIDIMEHVGYHPDSIYGTVHTASYNHLKRTQKGGTVAIPDNESTFHKYSIEWNQDSILYKVDEKPYFTFKNINHSHREWPFTKDFHIIMNVAMGGNWGGAEGLDTTITTATMEVDYVRVYKDSSPQKLF